MVRRLTFLILALAILSGAGAASFTIDTPPQTDPVVYVTKHGQKYHRNACRYLDQSKRAVKLTCARQFREPCKVCKPAQ